MAWRRPFRHAEDILCVLKSEAFLPITSITDYPDSIRSTEKGEEASTLLGAIAAAAPDAKPVVVEDDIGGSDADAPTVAPMASRRRGRRGSRGGRGTRGLGQGRGATANVVTASARRTGAAVLCLEEDVEPSSIDEQDTMLAQEADESAKRHTDDNSDGELERRAPETTATTTTTKTTTTKTMTTKMPRPDAMHPAVRLKNRNAHSCGLKKEPPTTSERTRDVAK